MVCFIFACLTTNFNRSLYRRAADRFDADLDDITNINNNYNRYAYSCSFSNSYLEVVLIRKVRLSMTKRVQNTIRSTRKRKETMLFY